MLIASILELDFPYEKTSNIKSCPPLSKGIPLQVTLGNPYLTNHIGVDCGWPLVYPSVKQLRKPLPPSLNKLER